MVNKISLIGVGYIGKIHIDLLSKNPHWEIAGIYDIDRETSEVMAAKYNVRSFATIDQAIESAEAVDIATPSVTHFSIAQKAIGAGKHVFVEKPVTSDLRDAHELQKMVYASGVVLQVGHVERFNPAFVAARPYLTDPKFIEVHRLAQYNPRGTDVSVVL